MRKITTAFAALLLLSACSNSPQRPGTFTTARGDTWVVSFVSSAVSGSTHVYINGLRVASGSFGLFFGNSASGSGSYGGKTITFFCTRRYTPDCLVYGDGEEIADIKFRYVPPGTVNP